MVSLLHKYGLVNFSSPRDALSLTFLQEIFMIELPDYPPWPVTSSAASYTLLGRMLELEGST